jgi:hypothetical protein
VASRLAVDIGSTIRQVYGRAKSGAAYGYTKVLGYHPIVAVRPGAGKILHARMRKGSANTARGSKRLVEKLWPGRSFVVFLLFLSSATLWPALRGEQEALPRPPILVTGPVCR